MGDAPLTRNDWRELRSQPAIFAHVSRIVHAFGGEIGEDIALRLCNEFRFRDRLSALLAQTYALSNDFGDDVSTNVVSQLVLASGSRVEDLTRQFGAIYWARAIIGQIEAGSVVALKQKLGDDAYAAALAHRDLAESESELPSNDRIAEAVLCAGLHCLAAWCSQQSLGISQRVRLKLPHSVELDGPVEPPFDTVGPRIVERLLA
jgi:hypothetical protein